MGAGAVAAEATGDGRINLLHPVVAAPLAGIALAEGLLFVGALTGATTIGAALAVHLLTLAGCALGPLRYPARTGLLFAFALVPLFRLVNLGLPVLVESPVFQFVLVYFLLVPGAVLVTRVRSVAPLSVGFRRGVRHAPAAAVLGAVLAPGEFFIIQPEALVSSLSVGQLVLLSAVMVGVVGLVEEWVFRGLLQETLAEAVGPRRALLLASGVFAVMHSQYGVFGELLYAGGIGLVFGLLYQRSESLLLVAVAHGVLNVFVFAVFPLTLV
jgi:membrane protease YdiL (CAAX protease family)